MSPGAAAVGLMIGTFRLAESGIHDARARARDRPVDHEDAIGLGETARQRDRFLRVAAVVGRRPSSIGSAADPAGGVDLVARELGADEPVLTPVHEDARHRHDHAQPHLVSRQPGAPIAGAAVRPREQGDDEADRERAPSRYEHVDSSAHASDSASRVEFRDLHLASHAPAIDRRHDLGELLGRIGREDEALAGAPLLRRATAGRRTPGNALHPERQVPGEVPVDRRVGAGERREVAAQRRASLDSSTHQSVLNSPPRIFRAARAPRP